MFAFSSGPTLASVYTGGGSAILVWLLMSTPITGICALWFWFIDNCRMHHLVVLHLLWEVCLVLLIQQFSKPSIPYDRVYSFSYSVNQLIPLPSMEGGKWSFSGWLSQPYNRYETWWFCCSNWLTGWCFHLLGEQKICCLLELGCEYYASIDQTSSMDCI